MQANVPEVVVVPSFVLEGDEVEEDEVGVFGVVLGAGVGVHGGPGVQDFLETLAELLSGFVVGERSLRGCCRGARRAARFSGGGLCGRARR